MMLRVKNKGVSVCVLWTYNCAHRTNVAFWGNWQGQTPGRLLFGTLPSLARGVRRSWQTNSRLFRIACRTSTTSNTNLLQTENIVFRSMLVPVTDRNKERGLSRQNNDSHVTQCQRPVCRASYSRPNLVYATRPNWDVNARWTLMSRMSWLLGYPSWTPTSYYRGHTSPIGFEIQELNCNAAR